MKKYLSLILALCLPALLGGCGAVPLPMPESPTPPPAADTEEITYEVSTDPYEQTVTAEDGTTLMVIDFQIPHLQAYANGALIEDPSTPAQEQAMDRVHTFNENFDQWRESNSSEENISFVKDLYRDMPEMFSAGPYGSPFRGTDLHLLPHRHPHQHCRRLLQLSGRCAPQHRVFRMEL